jgi:NAD(P)-dependent dehydrogenase (short-subunit alcohol dehydrogenase family)
MRLTGKIAIVTGSSRGLGKAIAVGLAREGADIVVASRTETEKERLPGTIYKTADEVRALGRRTLPIRCDVTSEQSVNDMVLKALAEFEHIDILVNNAGAAYPYPLVETPLKRWELMLRVNLTGAFLCIKAVLPKMIEQKSGSIINISSRVATQRGPITTGVAYAVAKAGIERLTYGLASEVDKYGIAVNCVKPRGRVSTEGLRALLPDADWSRWDSPDMMVKTTILLAYHGIQHSITGIVATDEELCSWYRNVT